MLFLQSHLSALLVPGSCSNAHLAWSHLRRNWGVSGSLSGNPEKETHKRVPILVPWGLHPTSSKLILSLRTHLGRQELDLRPVLKAGEGLILRKGADGRPRRKRGVRQESSQEWGTLCSESLP